MCRDSTTPFRGPQRAQAVKEGIKLGKSWRGLLRTHRAGQRTRMCFKLRSLISKFQQYAFRPIFRRKKEIFVDPSTLIGCHTSTKGVQQSDDLHSFNTAATGSRRLCPVAAIYYSQPTTALQMPMQAYRRGGLRSQCSTGIQADREPMAIRYSANISFFAIEPDAPTVPVRLAYCFSSCEAPCLARRAVSAALSVGVLVFADELAKHRETMDKMYTVLAENMPLVLCIKIAQHVTLALALVFTLPIALGLQDRRRERDEGRAPIVSDTWQPSYAHERSHGGHTTARQGEREREEAVAALKAQAKLKRKQPGKPKFAGREKPNKRKREPAQEKAARQEEVRRARQAEQEARIVELAKEEAAGTIQHIVFDFTDVTFNAGLAIQDVLLGFESYRIMFKNLLVESRVYLWIHRPSVAALEANTGKHAKHGQTSHKFTHSMLLLDLVPLVRFQHEMCGCGSVSPYRRRLRRVSRCKITDLRFSMATVAPTAVSHLRLAAAYIGTRVIITCSLLPKREGSHRRI
ncbi:hypothetical protein FIBSPDRAFT_883725 [Athelia psychrophila]|uniref:Uncharacterized protein n=1 Tax=Athelia psychrophila TaxID=1759441 RepID=A0A166TVD6_9AGAM|nr:hypothetical protein FIBSPDRAFT_883725 [Fibularhizoctonia sp. CBS 109695]